MFRPSFSRAGHYEQSSGLYEGNEVSQGFRSVRIVFEHLGSDYYPERSSDELVRLAYDIDVLSRSDVYSDVFAIRE